MSSISACTGGQIPHFFGPFQIPQGPADDQEGGKAQGQGGQLLQGFSRLYGGNGSHAHGAQEEGQGLQLKGAPADHRIEGKQQPLGNEDPAEAQGDAGKLT